jgi:hypothetical protein
MRLFQHTAATKESKGLPELEIKSDSAIRSNHFNAAKPSRTCLR